MSVFTTQFKDPQGFTLAIKAILPQANGQSTLVFPDGTVASCDLNGVIDYRPSGANGDWELCKVSGNIATFQPNRPNGPFFTKAFAVVPVSA